MRQVWYGGDIETAEKLSRKYGLVVISEIAAPAKLLDKVLHVPNFVSLIIRLPADLPAYLMSISSTTRYNIKQLEKKGFTYETLADPSWAGCFYKQYYKPTMLKSHGDEACILPPDVIRERFAKPRAELVKVHLNGVCVAAGINQQIGDSYHFQSFGWYNGDAELRKAGVVTAIYWYTILRAHDLKCTNVNLGGTPPYLENGVMHFKTRWAATLCKEPSSHGYRDLLLNPANAHCHDFLKRNSIVAYGEDNCFIVLSSKLPEACDLQETFLKDVEAWYLLRNEKGNDWDSASHRHLPVQLRGWYDRISLSYINKVPEYEMMDYPE